MNNESTIKLTVAIPNYNNRKLLINLLNSLKSVNTPHKIILVDNASQDDSVECVKKYFPDVYLIENKTNTGFAHAVNQAIKLSDTDYVLLLNNDTIVAENCFENMLDIIESDSSIFAVSSKMVQYHNRDLIDDAGDEYNLLGWSKKRGLDKSIDNFNHDEEVFSACAGAALYRRDIFSKIGYFDETFESYVEDMDISIRARLHGYKLYYSSKSIVYHYGSATSGSKYNSFKVKRSARNNIYLIYKNWALWMKILNFIFVLCGILIKYLFFYRKGLGKEYMDGIKEGFKTRNSLSKVGDVSFANYLKLEYLLIKNTCKFLF